MAVEPLRPTIDCRVTQAMSTSLSASPVTGPNPLWITRRTRWKSGGSSAAPRSNARQACLEELLLIGDPQHPQVGVVGHLLEQPVDHGERLPGPGRQNRETGPTPARRHEFVKGGPGFFLVVEGMPGCGVHPASRTGLK